MDTVQKAGIINCCVYKSQAVPHSSQCKNSHVGVAAGTQHISVLNVEKAGKLSIISCAPQHINNAYNCSVALQEQYTHMLRCPNVKRDTFPRQLGLFYNTHIYISHYYRIVLLETTQSVYKRHETLEVFR